jgi:pimeloyl-ACP methyl ester carboxylesterase
MPAHRQRALDIHYLVRGSGEPVLLLHGIGSSGADWAFPVPALESRFRVIVPDLPGSGHSKPCLAAYEVASIAASLWSLLDDIQVTSINIIGFSFGGAVALEMSLQRPESVPRLALINSLASYRIDHWRKWCEARIPALLVGMLGMQQMARLVATRMFPHSWQQPMRDRAKSVIAAVPAATYLGFAKALERWSAIDRLEHLRSRVVLIAAEFDYTPLADKVALAAQLHADLVVVRSSRHGTPFDSIEATNATLTCLAE